MRPVRFDRFFTKGREYGHAVGRVMVHESTLLKRQQVDRMLYSDYDDALGVAFDTAYGPYLEGAKLPADVEAGLMRFLADEYAFLDEACAGTHVAAFMHLKYDYHNLRVTAKSLYLGDTDGEHLLSGLGSVTPETIRAFLEGRGDPGFPARVAYGARVLRTMAEKVEMNSITIETVVDRTFLESRLAVAHEEESRPLEAFCRAAIDAANLLVILRGPSLGKDLAFYEMALAEGGDIPRKKLLSLAMEPFPRVVEELLDTRYGRFLEGAIMKGDKRPRFALLDRASDDYLMEQVRLLGRVSVGPERIVKYMTARENEAMMLRVIFVGKLNELSTELIESRIPRRYIDVGAK
ncbi:MAG: V-type ATPase subunit [Candidatus Geothermincolia bacterium]